MSRYVYALFRLGCVAAVTVCLAWVAVVAAALVS